MALGRRSYSVKSYLIDSAGDRYEPGDRVTSDSAVYKEYDKKYFTEGEVVPDDVQVAAAPKK